MTIPKLVTRTGGTGVDVFTVHLWYFEQGKFKEAWQGTMLMCSVFAETYFKKIGGYQVDLHSENRRIFAWETTQQYKLEQDGVTPKGDIKTNTTTTTYSFDGTDFVPD